MILNFKKVNMPSFVYYFCQAMFLEDIKVEIVRDEMGLHY